MPTAARRADAQGTGLCLASSFVSSAVDPLANVVADSHACDGVGKAERAAGAAARRIPAELCACIQQCPHHATTQRRVAEARAVAQQRGAVEQVLPVGVDAYRGSDRGGQAGDSGTASAHCQLSTPQLRRAGDVARADTDLPRATAAGLLHFQRRPPLPAACRSAPTAIASQHFRRRLDCCGARLKEKK